MKRIGDWHGWQLCLLTFSLGCGPTYMGPPTTMQPPTGYPGPVPAHQLLPPVAPAVPPEGATARSLNQIPDASPEDVYLAPKSGSKANYHRVAPGESTSSLARKYGLTMDDLRKANAWGSDHQLQVNELVLIPK